MKRASRWPTVLLAALLLCGCATSQTAPSHAPQEVAISGAQIGGKSASWPSTTTPDSLQTPKTPGAQGGQKSGILSGIGSLFSTPEGTARRQQVKLAKAAVPRKLGKGATYAPNNSGQISGGNRPGPVAQAADSAIAQNTQGGAAAAGPNARAEGGAAPVEAPDWKATLAAKLAGPLGLVLAVALVALGCYYLWPLLPRRKKSTPNA